MKMSKAFPIKMAIYTLVIAYLWLDLFVFYGPLSRRVKNVNPRSAENVAYAKEHGVAARVFYQPIYLTQVDYALEEKFWRQGKGREMLEGMSAAALSFHRGAVLQELIDDHLFRVKVLYNHKDFPVSEADIDAAVARFAGRFQHKAELLQAVKAQGWADEVELRSRLAARIQRERYLNSIIKAEVTEADARTWFEENGETIALPKRRKLRHVFLAVTDHEPEAGKKLIAEIAKGIRSGAGTFEEAVETFSNDPASKPKGGHLGWVSEARLPEGIRETVFALPEKTPTVMTTHLGWHLMEVLEAAPSQARTFEDAREEIVAALEATRREYGLRRYLVQLRNSNKARVEVFAEVLGRGWSL